MLKINCVHLIIKFVLSVKLSSDEILKYFVIVIIYVSTKFIVFYLINKPPFYPKIFN